VLERRVAPLAATIVAERRCEHAEAAVRRELDGLLEGGVDGVLVVGASAIVDRRDVVPAAVTAAGGVVEHYGMPVDPGNLLLLARCGETPVLGLPGCARSPKFNGVDRVLRRLAAGLPVTARGIMSMGVGGLLADTPERAHPRASAAAACSGARRTAHN